MASKPKKFPYRVKSDSVAVTIYRNRKKGGHLAYLVTYWQGGKRIQESKSDFDEAKRRAEEIAEDIAGGIIVASELTAEERMALVRASDTLAEHGIKMPVDMVCSRYAEARAVLQGRASVVEACRDWVKRHAVRVPRVSVQVARDELIEQANTDKKSNRRIVQLDSVLRPFAEAMNCNLTDLTPAIVSRYLSGLKFKERTRRNHRDVIGYFSRWCVLQGYLPKGADLLDGVQNYVSRRTGEIRIFTPEELSKLLRAADDRLVPFIAICAFAGLRHAEAGRLEWQEIELSDKPNDSFIEVKAHKSKVETRRLVPVSDNLKAWLLHCAKPRGRVCPFANITKQLLKCAKDAQVDWKHNGLRHSAISYRVAECADVPRVAEESGNSPAVIRSNYLKRVKPKEAAAWFAIRP